MSYQKKEEAHYRNFQGVNQKTSIYTTGNNQLLDIRNMDFNEPNALSKRPGSTQSISSGTSGPISSLYEFIKLNGSSYVIAGSDTAMFYQSALGLTLLSSGWNNGQPTDMLTFVDKLYMANGQKFETWNETQVVGFGPPCSVNSVNAFGGITTGTYSYGASFLFIWWGITSLPNAFTSLQIWLSYAYLRSDGRLGGINFYSAAPQFTTSDLGDGYVVSTRPVGAITFTGITTPSGYGISGIAIFMFIRQSGPLWTNSTAEGFSQSLSGAGVDPYASPFFRFVTLMPAGTTIASFNQSQITNWSALPASPGGTLFLGVGFSGNGFCFSNTYIPKYIEINQNRMWMSGFSTAPSQVFYSEVGEPENIEAESVFELRTNDGDRIFAIKEFQDQVIAFKQRSFHKIIGTSAETFQVVQLSAEYGCISNNAIAEFKDRLLFLDEKGVVLYNGASWEIISVPVEEVFRRMNLSVAMEKACAIHYEYRNQVWFGIPIDGSTVNNMVVVYDYILDAWTFFEGFLPASLATVKGNLPYRVGWFGDYSGKIHYFSESLYGDNGSGFTCLVFSKFDAPDGQNVQNMFRRLFVDVNTPSGVTGEIKIEAYSDYDQSTVRATFSVYQNQFQTRADFGVSAKSIGFKFSHFNASLPLTFYGYLTQRRYLRDV